MHLYKYSVFRGTVAKVYTVPCVVLPMSAI